MRVVGYVRVSTDRQADHGLGLDVQEAAVRSWARAGRHRVVEVLRDEGRSGADGLVGRPGLARALSDIKEKRADAIVVYRLDRLARDLILQELLRAEILRAGGELHSTDPVEDLHLVETPDNPTGRLVRRILGAIAEYERDMIVLRMRAGKSAKLERRGYAHGRPPYGWRAEGGELVPVDVEQRVIAQAVKLRRSGLSYRQIAAKLTESGATTRSGGVWSPQGVARVVERRQRRTGGGKPPDRAV